jgi:hypothetical protein
VLGAAVNFHLPFDAARKSLDQLVDLLERGTESSAPCRMRKRPLMFLAASGAWSRNESRCQGQPVVALTRWSLLRYHVRFPVSEVGSNSARDPTLRRRAGRIL